jgi:hypothetical protein
MTERERGEPAREGNLSVDLEAVLALGFTPGEARRLVVPQSELILELQPEGLVARIHSPLYCLELHIPVAHKPPSLPVHDPHEPSAEQGERPKAKDMEGRRLTLTGRLGRDISTRVTPRGRQVAKFPLGVNAGDQTVWHTVVLFDTLARQAVDQLELGKGSLITVVGYERWREISTKAGFRKVREIYAAALQPPGPHRSRGAQ